MSTRESHRIALSMIVFLAMVLGVAAWMPSASVAPPASAAQQALETGGTGVSYLPSQYVNQAKDIEPYIEPF